MIIFCSYLFISYFAGVFGLIELIRTRAEIIEDNNLKEFGNLFWGYALILFILSPFVVMGSVIEMILKGVVFLCHYVSDQVNDLATILSKYRRK